jgi:hypothetical protein
MTGDGMPGGTDRELANTDERRLAHPLLVALVSALVSGVFVLIAAAISSRSGGSLGGVLATAPPATATVTVTATSTVTVTNGTSSASQPSDNDSPRLTTLKIPLPEDHLDYTGIELDKPGLSGGGTSDLYYQKNEADQTPELSPGTFTVVSTDRPSTIDRAGCAQAADTAPIAEDSAIRNISKGDIYCMTISSGAVVALEVKSEPDRTGRMTVMEMYWPP